MDDWPFAILDAGKHECTPAWDSRGPIRADVHRLYHTLAGEAEVFADGRWESLRAGRVYLVPGHQQIAYRCRRMMRLYWLHFRANDAEWDSALADLGRVRSWPASRWRPWRDVVREWASLAAEPSLLRQARTQAVLLYFICGLVAERIEQRRGEDPHGWRERLAPAIFHMDRNAHDGPSLGELASLVNLSPRNFHRRFVEVYRTTPHAYLESRRMRTAQRLLRDPAQRIADVARATGYSSPYYFSRAFKRFHGVSPSEARRRASGGP